MIGKCLCGKVQFEIKGKVPHLYQCHCSLCRKQSGSSANAATFIFESDFAWSTGEDFITSFVKDTGFRTDFCSNCGSPVPNRLRTTDKYWVPAGLLEGEDDQEVVAHLYTQSKACWDQLPSAGKQYKDMPDIETLNKALQRTSR
ncbi:GFA family protein [Halomonas sp. SH5A2]|uniref:GFA family protein n=1 Tax=Halomonas sp. SH5A2 TaxID=2749040 RepID=UPI0016418EDB|nr:GFA family protein [Halomonas sp. SH5A2]QNI03231.1 GFA family protein [Halomonas sp. SH5A2]